MLGVMAVLCISSGFITIQITLHMPIAVIIDNFAAQNPAAVFTFVLVSRHFVLSLMKSNH